MALPVNSKWEIIRSNESNVIQITSSNETNFEAKYLDGDGSIFVGEIRKREKAVLALTQHNQITNYYAFHVGKSPIDSDVYEGFFCDNYGTESVNFKLTRLE